MNNYKTKIFTHKFLITFSCGPVAVQQVDAID